MGTSNRKQRKVGTRKLRYPPLSNEELEEVLSRLQVNRKRCNFMLPADLIYLQNTLHKWRNTDSKHIDDYLIAMNEINRRVRILGLRE